MSCYHRAVDTNGTFGCGKGVYCLIPPNFKARFLEAWTAQLQVVEMTGLTCPAEKRPGPERDVTWPSALLPPAWVLGWDAVGV